MLRSMKIYLILLTILIILLLVQFERIKFEYYVWNLSSENVSERETFAAKIVKMDSMVVPLLIKKLDSRYIFETEYIIECLEKIIGIPKEYPKDIPTQTAYWKKWWTYNKQKF